MQLSVPDQEWRDFRRETQEALCALKSCLQGEGVDKPNGYPGLISEVKKLQDAETERKAEMLRKLSIRDGTKAGVAASVLLAVMSFLWTAIWTYVTWQVKDKK